MDFIKYPISVLDNMDFGKYYAVYVGEQWDDHCVNWDWFYVSETFDEVLWGYMIDWQIYTLSEWRISPYYRQLEIGNEVECFPMYDNNLMSWTGIYEYSEYIPPIEAEGKIIISYKFMYYTLLI